jgi:hypothetical protein
VDDMSRHYTNVPQAPLIDAINKLPVVAASAAAPWMKDPVGMSKQYVGGMGARNDLKGVQKKQRELPDWLDQSIEARHADLPLAILSAITEAKTVTSPVTRTSVPIVPHKAVPFYEPVCCENFG